MVSEKTTNNTGCYEKNSINFISTSLKSLKITEYRGASSEAESNLQKILQVTSFISQKSRKLLSFYKSVI